MPDLGHMVIVDSHTLLIDLEWPQSLGEPVEAIECLIIEVQVIGEGDVHNIGQPDGDVLGVQVARIGLRAHLVRFLDVEVVG